MQPVTAWISYWMRDGRATSGCTLDGGMYTFRQCIGTTISIVYVGLWYCNVVFRCGPVADVMIYVRLRPVARCEALTCIFSRLG